MKKALQNYFIDKRKTTGWASGKIGGFAFEAKIYDEPSEYGINNGRISKLLLKQDGKEVFSFDRGLDHSSLPDSIVTEVTEALETIFSPTK